MKTERYLMWSRKTWNYAVISSQEVMRAMLIWGNPEGFDAAKRIVSAKQLTVLESKLSALGGTLSA